ncbi:MAG TPA: DNA polymerase IV [Vicinamibacterales bacterium]|nr:DNA polymerase IV [Vicinamibacterales bacterium]
MAHVDLDSFFVAVERSRHPELIDRPVIVGGPRGGRGNVASASREARRCGVRAGMPLAEASIRCPDGVFLDGAFDAYFAASLQIDEVLRRESADVEWQSIDEVYVGLAAGPRPRAAGAIAAAERIRQAVRDLGFDAALGLARSKLVARIASQLARPRGVVHVLDGYEARFLSPLKIDVLPDVDAALARRFRAAGIRRLGQIVRLSESELARFAGRSGATLARRAAGIDATRIRRTALPPPRTEDRDLPSPSADAGNVHAALRAEVERLGRELRSRGVFARTLTVRLRFADGRLDSRTASLPEPSALDEVLFAAAIDLLPRLWTGDRLVRAVGVSCAGLLAGTRDAALFAT